MGPALRTKLTSVVEKRLGLLLRGKRLVRGTTLNREFGRIVRVVQVRPIGTMALRLFYMTRSGTDLVKHVWLSTATIRLC